MSITNLFIPKNFSFRSLCTTITTTFLGKSGPPGVGEVLHNCKVEVLLMSSENMGVCDSSEPDWLAILEALSPEYNMVGLL